MTPYYQDDAVTIYHGDCREILADIDLSDADCVLTDPPYSSGGFQESGKSSGSIGTRSDERIALDNLSTRGYRQLMRETLRHLNQCDELFLFTDWRMWIEAFDSVEGAGWRVRNMLVWDKATLGMGSPFRQQHELIAYGKRTGAPITTGDTGNVLTFRRSGNKNHPTEKPVDLLGRLLHVSGGTGTVVDPFMGSGSTLVAAKSAGRRVIGIEMSEMYCETAARRAGQEVLDLGGAA